MKKEHRKGNVMVDGALLLCSILVASVISVLNPSLGISGLLVLVVVIYVPLEFIYCPIAFLLKLPRPKFFLFWPW